MEIIEGKTSGFCGGVRNAFTKAEQELDKTKEEIYCLGELVHNKQVIEKLEKKGLKTIEDIEEAKDKAIIRAHGVSKEVYKRAKQKGIELIDLTCPKVLQIHKMVEEYAQKEYFIMLVGVENHPEVIGTMSFCGENSFLIRNEEDIGNAIKSINKSKILILAQTTYSLKKFEEILEKIKNVVGDKYQIDIKDTICPATRMRQEETEELSKKVDYMIIVGGKNSSNTKKLYEIAKANCKNSVVVETVQELDLEYIRKLEKIGIMAGASTPKESVEEIKILLSKFIP